MVNPKSETRLRVIHFQRKARPFNFSIESIFENVRSHLKDKVAFSVKVCSQFNDGYFSKLSNIIEAAFRQKKNAVNHITGEVNFLDLLMRKKNVLLTIHDCRYVERKKGIEKAIVKWLYLKAPVKKAALVTAVSETTKQQIICFTGCTPDKIIVIPVPVNEMFKPAPKNFNKKCPVILQIGTGENKNVLRIIEAIKDINCMLVLVGELHKAILEQLKKNHTRYIAKSNLSAEEMYNEYVNADIISFVSTYEGFGMPIIEANAVERVVITSGISSMPEVGHNAACYVNPYDVDDIKKGFLKLVENDEYRGMLIANGRLNKLRFDPQRIADAYYSIYQKMVLS